MTRIEAGGRALSVALVGAVVLAGLAIGGCEGAPESEAPEHEPTTGTVASALTPAIVTWTMATPVASPPARSFHGLAYDGARKNVLLFGGYDVSRSAVLADTWTFDGKTWAPLTPTMSPGARAATTTAYDIENEDVVLFGGVDSEQKKLGDTWTWNGTSWTARLPAHTPPARSRHAMTYDAARKRVVVFGGLGAANDALADTWTWDGTDWTEQTPATSPPGRGEHGMTYDAARSVVVLFGGSTPAPSNDTWTWDGTTWQDVTPAPPALSPPVRATTGLVYDRTRTEVVLFGGRGELATTNDTWTWNGTTWADTNAATPPPAREGHAIVFDGVSKGLVMFGGVAVNAGPASDDTWLYATRAGSCTTSSQCTSGSCVDGACCEAASCGSCQACSAQTGKCTAVTSATDLDSCATVCDAVGLCMYQAPPPNGSWPGSSGGSGRPSDSSSDQGPRYHGPTECTRDASGMCKETKMMCAATSGQSLPQHGVLLGVGGLAIFAVLRRRRK